MRRTLAAVVLVVCTLAPAGAAGQGEFASTGGTSVSVDAPIVTITVTIDIVLSDPNAEGVGDWANGIAQQIMDYWNDGLANVSSCPFYDLVVVLNPVPLSAAHEIVVNGVSTFVTVPGHHVVAWEGSGPNAPWPETYDAYDADQVVNPGEDSANAYGHELWAVWSGHLASARDFAHEFGHLLGFGDDYLQNGLPIPERNGTLMDNGDLIDSVLANRLVDIIKQSGKRLPECWTGSMDLTLSKDYLAEPTGLAPEVCEGSWRVTPTFSVAEDGSVSGSAIAELRSGPDCTFEVPGTGARAEFNVEGTSSPNALELRFVQTSIEPPGDWVGLQGAMATTYLVPRTSPTHAELQTPVDTTDGGPFPVTGEATIALECSTCSPPAN